MQLEALDQQRVRLRPAHFDASLELCGIDQALLARMLAGDSIADRWTRAVSSRGAWVGLDGEARHYAEPTAARTQRLHDGDVSLRSGHSGCLRVHAGHAMQHTLWPTSLNLLVTQQWARLGLMPAHAAVLEIHGTGVLVLGRRGGGKSILCLAALCAGQRVVSDDWVLLGQHARQVIAERIRPFLMLRPSWASQRLLEGRDLPLPSLAAMTSNKAVLRIPTGQPEFPRSARIERIWLLERPKAARSQDFRREPADGASVLARLIEASMPLLFSSEFPEERQHLLTLCSLLAESARLERVVTGTRLIERPEAELERMLA